ncbi:mitochondrial ribosomal small subunit component, partial [Nowakowskiella sp. JEL0078]
MHEQICSQNIAVLCMRQTMQRKGRDHAVFRTARQEKSTSRKIYFCIPIKAVSKENMGGRSAWKGPFFVNFPAVSPNEAIKTMVRSCTVLPSFIGMRFLVHNGKDYIPLLISEEMVGRKLGEFAPTRKPFTFKKTAPR